MCNRHYRTLHSLNSPFVTVYSIIVIITAIAVFAYLKGIYKYVSKTNYVSRVYSVVTVLYLSLMLLMLNVLYLHWHYPQYVCSAKYGCFL
jgi:hypothetical protein